MVWLAVPRWSNRRLDDFPPAAAGDFAFRLFCTPEVSQWRHRDHDKLAARARYHLRSATRSELETPAGRVHLYAYNPYGGEARGTVLIVHGWTSEASFMAALAEPLRRGGFRVVMFDMPGHGRSEGRSTNLIDCARATLTVGQNLGPLAGVVAHSFGGMVALLAMEGGAPMSSRLDVPRIALLSVPNRLAEITRLFARHWGLSEAGLREFERRLERVGHRSLADFTTVKLLTACRARALVAHAYDDDAVPFSAAREIASEVAEAQLQAFEGLGHRNILFAPQVARAVAKFFNEA